MVYPELLRRHASTIWCHYIVLMLGFWLLTTPAIIQEKLPLQVNDIVVGLLLIIFGALSLSIKRSKFVAAYGIALLGIWLQLAPLVFWAENPATYINDTLIGALAFVFSIIIPGTPGEIESGPTVPVGWSYNPSAWSQRLPVATLSFIAYLSARYMAAFQLGYITTMFDPLFHDGTYKVITSTISKSFPVSDAGLGAALYMIETLLSLKGGPRRWHTMPWMVALFGFLVVPVGFVSIILIMLQPVVVHAWCFWCLLTAFCMLLMIAFTVDEVYSSIQFLRRSCREGFPFWKTFFCGRVLPENQQKEYIMTDLDSSFAEIMRTMGRGIRFSWVLIALACVGIWLMFFPDYAKFAYLASDIDHVIGALVTAFSIIALAELVRPIVYTNLIFSPLLFMNGLIFHENMLAFFSNVICALLLLIATYRIHVLSYK